MLHVPRYSCQRAPLNSGNESLGWWSDRREEQHFYWAGDGAGELEEDFRGRCDCHARGSCVKPGVRCNCDAGAEAWTYDAGHITDR